ncbi:MAG: phage integrase SAM-like domain-containing protein [Dysgonamonadaceae bacterium]|jgi:hypothetical protein|nr:site-specific integrase [Mollicutes bacterium]NLO03482.1 site-specific integrase [Bacteroidales bacterium]
MANITVWVYEKKPLANKKLRVYIRLIHKNRIAYHATNIAVFPKDIAKSDNGYRIKDKRIALVLSQIINDMDQEILDMGIKTDHYSASMLINTVLRRYKRRQPDFVDFSKYYIKTNFAGRNGSAENYSLSVKRLCEFYGREKILANEITIYKLNQFEKWLRDRGLERGVTLYLTSIQKLFKEMRLAYNDYDNDDIVIKNNPFEAYRIPRSTPKRKKRSLTLEELMEIRNYQCKNYKDTFTRDMFMLSFYMVGMNSRDLYDCPAPVMGRIEYNRGKTKDRREDEAFISIKVEPEAQEIINKYKGKKKLLDLKDFVSFKQFNNILNKHLKNIAPGLFFYMARHTWASLARNKCDVSKDDVAMALNHIDQALKTTDTYIDPDWTIIDRANRKVLDYVASIE